MCPMNDKTSQSALEHYGYLKFALLALNHRLSSVVVLVRNNASTNRAFTRLVGAVLIGCYSDRFSLAVKDYKREQEFFIDKTTSIDAKTFLLNSACTMTESYCPLFNFLYLHTLKLNISNALNLYRVEKTMPR